MKTAHALFAGCVLIALAIVFVTPKTVIGQVGGGQYRIASDGGAFVWRVNVNTGQVSYCVRRDSSIDPVAVARNGVFCSRSSVVPGQEGTQRLR